MFHSILPAARALYPDAVKMRRHLHAHPELSGGEKETARFIHARLRRIGLRPRYHMRGTGVTARIENGPGPMVVLRADTDALPLEEHTGVSFHSRNPGVMHACGHDMHMASLMGAAQLLIAMRRHWRGSIVCLFQPSEEAEPGGALGMIDEGAFPGDAAAVFGQHVSPDHVTGQVGLKEGDDYAGVLVFDVTVRGRGGHGATPERTVDPIVCACAMVMNLQTLVSRECPPFEPAVVTVGSLHAGTKRNIIPDDACFQGTVRTFSPVLQRQLARRIRQILDKTARSYRAQVCVTFEKSYPPGCNDRVLTDRTASALATSLGRRNIVRRVHPIMYAEDFAYFQRRAPGVYLHLGVRPPHCRSMPGPHNAKFLPEEKALITGMATHATFAVEMLGL